VKPVDAKVEVIIKYPTPTTKKELMRFLGTAGYYRKFCRNFASVCEPLTNLLKKDSRRTVFLNGVRVVRKPLR